MNPEEAIDVLNRYIANIESGFTKPEELEPFKAYKAAIEALEKQVAKKPDDCGDCPNCHCRVQETIYENDPNYGVYEIYDDYCRMCGQAIDWTEELE